MPIDGNVFGVVVAGGTLLLLFLSWSHLHCDYGKKSYRFPPSPPMNAIWRHRLPTERPFLTTASWIEQYGPVISLRANTYRYVVIGRYKAAMEIMEKQGSASADRPRFVGGGEMLTRGLRMLLMHPGERLKRMRKALHSHLQPKAAQTYQSLQTTYAKRTILCLLEDPEQYQKHAYAYSASVTLKLTYGQNTPAHASDPEVLQIRKSSERLLRSMRPDAYLVDSFPWLKHVPWYGRKLRQGFIEDHALFHRQLDAVKNHMNDPDSGPSLAKFLLTGEMDFGLGETEIAFLAGSMFTAGTAIAFCLAMTAAAHHPDAQAAVHAELDAVVGNDRAPTFDDEMFLPVLGAFVLESMRWRPPSSDGVPHRGTEDIIWDGYRIPAGTIVYGSHWAISRDPDVFPDPDKFDLTRWLTSDGSLRNDLKPPYFGFGRRVCPGQHVATRSLFINMALVLWSFHLSVDASKPADDMGFLRGGKMSDDIPIGLHFKPRMSKEKLTIMMEQ